MFLRSFSNLLRDAFVPNTRLIYKVESFGYSHDCTTVRCKALDSGIIITLKLNEIIRRKLRFFSNEDILLLFKAFENNKKNKNIKDVQKNYLYYNVLSLALILCLLMSNLAELKIFNFFGYAIGAGTVIFPLIYILNDVLTEVYGFSASRKAIWAALCSNCILSIFLYLVCLLPPSQYWADQAIFEKMFLLSPRIVTGSIISYLIGEMVNSYILSMLKIRLSGKLFAIRAVISTFIGALIESCIFAIIAFSGRIPMSELVNMILMLAFIKVTYEILAMPITVKTVIFLKSRENVDSFEIPSIRGFVPFLSNF